MENIEKISSAPQEAPVRKAVIREYVFSIIIALVVALTIRTIVIQSFKIPSGSMENTLLVGDYLMVNKFIYGTKIPFSSERVLKLRDPKRGDIIVFEYPKDGRDFIKRVIGLPGDSIEIRNKKVYINGSLYENPHEMHTDNNVLENERDNFGPIRVPEGSYFVMGDNRDNSYDSRFWGFVRNEKILGLAFIKYWSWDSAKSRPRPERIGRPIE